MADSDYVICRVFKLEYVYKVITSSVPFLCTHTENLKYLNLLYLYNFYTNTSSWRQYLW